MELLKCLQQPSEEFVPENQSAYYSFIKEALLLQKRKKKKLNYSVPCDVIASLMAHILFFFLVLQKYIKNTEEVNLRLYKFDIIIVV